MDRAGYEANRGAHQRPLLWANFEVGKFTIDFDGRREAEKLGSFRAGLQIQFDPFGFEIYPSFRLDPHVCCIDHNEIVVHAPVFQVETTYGAIYLGLLGGVQPGEHSGHQVDRPEIEHAGLEIFRPDSKIETTIDMVHDDTEILGPGFQIHIEAEQTRHLCPGIDTPGQDTVIEAVDVGTCLSCQ